MPPEPMSRVKSHLRSLYQYVKSLSVCAMTNASTAATHGLQQLISQEPCVQHRPVASHQDAISCTLTDLCQENPLHHLKAVNVHEWLRGEEQIVTHCV